MRLVLLFFAYTFWSTYFVQGQATFSSGSIADSMVCAGTNGIVYVADDLSGPYSWNVLGGSIISGQGTQSVTVDWGTSTSGAIELTVGAATVTKTITITALPEGNLAGTATICAGQTTYLSVLLTGIGPFDIQYFDGTTIFAQNGISNGDVIAVSPTVTTTYSLVSVIDKGTPLSCSALILIGTPTVTVNTLPTGNISGNKILCKGDTATIHVSMIGTGPFEFDYSNGFSTTTVVCYNTDTSIIINPSNTASYTLTRLIDLGITPQCQATQLTGTATFTVNPLPTGTISGLDTICPGGSAIINFSFSGTGPFNAVYSDGTNSFNLSNVPDSVSVTVSPATTTTYSLVSLTDLGTSPNCVSNNLSGFATITIEPFPTITATQTNFCSGDIQNFSGSTGLWSISSNIGSTINSVTGSYISGTANVAEQDTVSLTSPAGCKTQLLLTVHSRPFLNHNSGTQDTAFCQGGILTFAQAHPSDSLFGGSSGTIFIGTGNVSVQFNIPQQEYIISKSSGNCRDTILVTINPFPNVIATPLGDTTFCQGDSVVLEAQTGYNSYQWFRDGFLLSGATQSSYTAAISGNYKVEIINSFGCRDTSSEVTVTAKSLPIANITTNDPQIFCFGNQAVIHATTGLLTYQWFQNGLAISGAIADSFIVTQSGIYNVLVSNTLGCVDSSANAILFVVNSLPVSTLLAQTTTTFCQGDSVVLEATSGFSSYNWLLDGISLGVTNSNLYTATVSGNYQAIVLDGNGCSDTTTQTITVTVNPIPVSQTISGKQAVCRFTNNVVYSVPATLGSTYSWQVSGGSITSGSGTNSITVDWGGFGDGLILLTEKNKFNCVGPTDSLSVLIDSIATLSVKGVSIACLNTTESYVTQHPGSNYVWNAVGGVILSGQGTDSITVNWNTAGAALLQLTVSNTSGCTTSVSNPVNVVNQLGTPIIVGDTLVCRYVPESYHVAHPGPVYNWVVSGGNILFGQNTDSVVVEWINSGIGGGLTCYVSNGGNCADSSSYFAVQVDTVATPQVFGANTNICAKEIFAYWTDHTGPSYTWKVVGGQIISTIAQDTIIVFWDTPGNGYVRLVVTNTNGCQDSLDYAVTVNDSVRVPLIIGDTAACSNSTKIYRTNHPGPNYLWFIAGGTILSGQGTATVTVNWGTVPLSGIAVKVTNAIGCQDSSNIPVHITVVDASFSGLELGYCLNSPPDTLFPVQAGGTFVGVGMNGNIFTPSILGTQTIKYIIVNGECIDTVAQTTFVTENPFGDAGSDIFLCQGRGPVTLQGATLGAPGCNFTYQWYDVNGNFISAALKPVVNPSSTTGYIFTTNCNGCTSTPDTVMVFVSQTLQVLPYNNQVAFCAGSGGTQIGVTASGGAGNYAYAWYPTTGLSSAFVANPIANPTASTRYVCVVTDIRGCSSDSVEVFALVDSVPQANAGPDKIICKGSGLGVFLNGQGVGGGFGSYHYRWYPSTGLSDSSILNPYANPDTTTIYVLQVISNQTGCSSSPTALDTVATAVVFVEEIPTAHAGPDTFVCLGGGVPVGNMPEGGGLNYSYLWSPSTGLSDSTARRPMASPTQTTTYFVTVISNGCASTVDSVLVTVIPKATAEAGPNKQICPKDSTVLEGLGTLFGVPDSLLSYRWEPTQGLDNPYARKPMASPDTTTWYRLFVGYLGCEGIYDSVLVTVSPVATVDADSTNSPIGLVVCSGAEIQLPARVIAPVQPVHIEWYPTTGLDNPFTLNPIARPTESIVYYLSARIGACTITDSVVVNVLPGIVATVSGDTNRICQGDFVVLRSNTGLGQEHYEWSPTIGLLNNGTSQVVVAPMVSTLYTVKISEASCEDTASYYIEVLPKPEAKFVNTIVDGCVGHEVSFVNQAQNGVSWLWIFGDGTFSNEHNPVHIYQQPGIFQPILIARATGGCEDTFFAPEPIIINELQAEFVSIPNYPVKLVLPLTEIVFIDSTPNSTSWLWLFGDGTSATGKSVTHSYQYFGTYYVTLFVTNQIGCTDTVIHGPYSIIEPDIIIPDVFTPNGDGINEVFKVNYTGGLSFQLVVLDRYGMQMFETNDLNTGWNGKNNGTDVPEGVYYYKVIVGNKHPYTGNVTLLR